MNLLDRRAIWLVAIAVVVAVGAIVVASRLSGGDGADEASFFAEATAVTCNGSPAGITVDGARFAAFSGDLTAGGSDKLALVDIRDANTRTGDALLQSFTLAEPDETFTLERVDLMSDGRYTLAFRVPKGSGAFKLVFDDGCAREEWLIP